MASPILRNGLGFFIMNNKIKIFAIAIGALLIASACNTKIKPLNDKKINDLGVNCGPKALSGIIRYYRLEVPWDSLAKLSHTNINGTSMYDLANTARLLGFEANGVKTGYPGLSELPLPSLIFVNNNHYATLMWVGQDSVLIDDEGSRNFIKRGDFLKIWDGKVLALYPGKELQNKLNQNIKR